nr:hypothetical protein CFP56_46728 [Quercus suber]
MNHRDFIPDGWTYGSIAIQLTVGQMLPPSSDLAIDSGLAKDSVYPIMIRDATSLAAMRNVLIQSVDYVRHLCFSQAKLVEYNSPVASRLLLKDCAVLDSDVFQRTTSNTVVNGR